MATKPSGKKPAPRKQAPEPTKKPAAKTQEAAGIRTSVLRQDIESAKGRGFPFYVYTLADASGVFYVGKGTGGRLFQHERLSNFDRNAVKKQRIMASGEPQKTIIGFFRDAGAALECEAERIKEGRDHLTNIARGTITWDQSAKARMQLLLDNMAQFDVWSAGLSQQKAQFCIGFAGSLRRFYDLLLAAIQAEALSPTPTRFFQPHVTYRGTEPCYG